MQVRPAPGRRRSIEEDQMADTYEGYCVKCKEKRTYQGEVRPASRVVAWHRAPARSAAPRSTASSARPSTSAPPSVAKAAWRSVGCAAFACPAVACPACCGRVDGRRRRRRRADTLGPCPGGRAMRPLLKPALRRLWRDPATLQLGIDPRHAVVLGGVDLADRRCSTCSTARVSSPSSARKPSVAATTPTARRAPAARPRPRPTRSTTLPPPRPAMTRVASPTCCHCRCCTVTGRSRPRDGRTRDRPRWR